MANIYKLPRFLFCVLSVLLIILFPADLLHAEEGETSPPELSKIMSTGTVTLNMFFSDLEMGWFFFDRSNSEDGDSSDSSLNTFSFGMGLGIFPVRYLNLEGLFRFRSYSSLSFSDLGIGISYLPPLGHQTFLDFGPEFIWRNLSPYSSGNEDRDLYEVGGHLGAGVFLSKHLSLGVQGYYHRVEAGNYNQNWYGANFRLTLYFPR